ncbi:MAG TPA: IS1595 family transposase [Candidatus Baltobacteraceae bacterium]|nr:IS1595 family transposase [Candidatus Baltobacteraceae bacterium]
MEKPVRFPTTLLEAVRYFGDLDVAHKFATMIRWPNGVACPRMGCGSADVHYISTRRMWRCNDCKRQFSTKVGTIFEDSPIGYDKWLPAMWMLASDRNGISSCELARALGVTQKTAWFMLHRIRHAMKSGTFQKLHGEVEADETYIGARLFRANNAAKRRLEARNIGTNPRGGQSHLTAVLGMKQRGGPVRAMVVPNTRTFALNLRLRDHVEKGSTLYTDAWNAYEAARFRFVHKVVNHSVEYVSGEIHTNSIESFWSVLKRTIKGTYICPRPKHLDRYLDEQVWRFNNREDTDGKRLTKVLKQADGARLTYQELINE